MKKIPVFQINGFLDAGKTTFILATIRRDGFNNKGKTLLLVCEEGEIEYDSNELSSLNVVIEKIDENSFNSDYLYSLYKKYKPNRVVIEMNFMWDQSKLSYPNIFNLSQVITIVDGQTFPIYFNNMRQKFIDVIKFSDVVAFNKISDGSSLEPFKNALKVTNSNCLYCLINEQCISTQELFPTELPYNLDDEEIFIDDKDFGTFYIDTFDNRSKYQDKIVNFNAWVVKSKKLPPNTFIAGRKVLNCCANDIQLFGFLVSSCMNLDLKDDSWVQLKAKCSIEYNQEYDEEEIILHPIAIKIIDPIENEILDLR